MLIHPRKVSLFEQHALRDAILERMPLQCAEESRLGKEEASLTYKVYCLHHSFILIMHFTASQYRIFF
jgi:hypothetical protein